MSRDLFDADVQFTEKTMRRVLYDFETECPLWHVLLTPVYFAAEPSPARAEQWRLRALQDTSGQYADLYGHYLGAVGWMLGKAEKRLDRASRMRLVAPSPYPWDLKTLRPTWLRDEARRRRVRGYYRFLEELGDEGEAYRLAAEATGHSERAVREGLANRRIGPQPS
jgi:hypothetical protein